MLDDLTIDQAVTLLTAPRDITIMPFGKFQGKPLDDVPKDYVEWLAKSGAFDKAENEELRKSFEKVGALSSKS